MDPKTITYYDTHASSLADTYESIHPEKLYELISLFFRTTGGLTVDLGCGSGRDTQYLHEKDYKVIGLDASEGMQNEARARHPGIEFRQGQLPNLAELKDSSVENMLCSGVFMHLPEEDLIPAALNCRRVMSPQGILILSFRDNEVPTTPDATAPIDQRLFTSVSAGRLALLFESIGMRVLYQGTAIDSGGRGFEWKTLVIQNTATAFSDGIARIQGVLEHDRTTATYKLALIRALCRIALKEPACVQWRLSGEEVLVPVRKISEYWLKFYWGLQGVKQTTGQDLAFRADISRLKEQYLSDFHLISTAIESGEELPVLVKAALKKIASTLVRGPVHHSGSHSSPIFSYWGDLNRPLNSCNPSADALNHFIAVPGQIWRDLIQFNQWINDSVQIRWAELTVEMDKEAEFSTVLSLLRKEYEDDLRKTQEIRTWLLGRSLNRSVWSGRTIEAKVFEVDHIIPFAVAKNNDLWNLVPAIVKENRDKSDQIPTQRALEVARSGIRDYWEFYQTKSPNRFSRQLKDALGTDSGEANWPKLAFHHLLEMAERIATTRSLRRWDGA